MRNLWNTVALHGALLLLPSLALLTTPARAQTFGQAYASAVDASRSMESPAVNEPFRLDFGALQDDPPASLPEVPEDDWRVDVTAYMWLTAMDGDVGVGPLTRSVHASFIDILESTDSFVGLAGRLEIGKGRWAGFIEALASKMGVEDLSGPAGAASADLSSTMILVDFGAMFRVFEEPASNGGGRPHMLDVYAGGRFQSIDVELDPEVAATRSESKNWLDPIVGARGIIQLSERFDLTLMGDIGGFGVGSDLTWSLRALVGYHFTMFDTPATVFAGYAALGTDYVDGSGLGRFEWDIISHGPLLGLTLAF